MSVCESHPRTSELGFTLIELLVVMSLLSVIMLGLVSALRTMAQTESKIDQRLERLDDVRVARTFLQQTLTRASALAMDAPNEVGKKIIPFVATPRGLTWVGILPARPNVGGRYFFRLQIEEDTASGPELVLRFAPWQPDVLFSDWSNAQSRVLVKGIQKITIQAQGLAPQGHPASKTWPLGWQNGWPIVDALPERLRLTLVDAQGEWPEWMIALQGLPSDSNLDVTVVGGGSR